MEAKDFLLEKTDTGNYDLIIKNGDFVIGNSDEQHIATVVMAQKGEFKEFPALGFGATSYLKRDISEMEFLRDLKVQLEYEGYYDMKAKFTETGDLRIENERKSKSNIRPISS